MPADDAPPTPGRPGSGSPTLDAQRRWLRWGAALGAASLGLVAVALVAPAVPLEGAAGPLIAAVFAFACVAAEVIGAALAVPRARPRSLLLLLPALALLAVVGGDLPLVVSTALVTIGLLAFGTVVGAVVGEAIEEAGYLIVVAAVSTLVDIFSVLHPRGPTAQLVQIEAALNVLVLPWPILGTARIEPVLGVGDVAFAAIYMVASRRHGLSTRRTAVALAIGLAVTLSVVLATGVGIPALPFLGVAVVAAHPEARRVPASDRRSAAIGLGLLVAVFVALFLFR